MAKLKKIKFILILIAFVNLIALIISFSLLLFGVISPKVNSWFIFLSILSAQVLALYNFWYLKKKNTADSPLPSIQAHVRIAGKRKAPPNLANPLAIPQDNLCFITFVFEDGTVHEISVSAQTYFSLNEGQSGLLTYKEHENYCSFIGFQREA